MATTSARTDSLVGSTLGKDYRVVEQIGMGGMAVVYLVEHQTLQKRFAAKVLSIEQSASEEARARFTQEAHAASQLDHENIVTISDFGMTPDERPFYVMELLRGQTLMDRLEQGPMTLEEVVAVSVPVARALAHAHAEGVIHRDVKPENVFLVQRSQGRWSVKVLDFGIAKVTTNPALTKMGQALGSPMFMSPEACRGDDVDQRSDLYSFGIVLYLMLTRRVPFSDESLLKILQMQVTSPVPSPREHEPDISPELEAVVMRALAKDPDDRYPTMEALLFDLQLAVPEGSDNLLIQAQFGTSLHDTPFPSQSLRMIAQRSSQRLMIGDLDASTHLSSASKRFPAAPPRRGRKVLLGIGILGLLAGGGGVGWRLWTDSVAAETTARIAAAAPAIAAPPAPAAAPAAAPVAAPTPAAPPVIDPPAVEPVPDPAPAPPLAAKPAPIARPIARPAAPKRVAIVPKAVTPKATTKAELAAPPVVVPEPKPVAPEPTPAVTVAPVVPVETPRAAPPPAAGSATPAVVTPKPKPIDAGSLDAVPTIASLDVNGPLPSSTVRRSVERLLPALRACYKAAAKTQKSTPLVSLSLSFEIDENSTASSVTATGASFGSLSSCARTAISRLQTQQAPDVGTARVVVAITFRPS